MKRHDLHFIHVQSDGGLYCSADKVRLTDEETAVAWAAFETMSGATQEQAFEKAAEHDASFVRRLTERTKNAVYGLRNKPGCVVIA